MRHISFITLFLAAAVMAASCTEDDDILSTEEYRKAKGWDASMVDKAASAGDTLKAAGDSALRTYDAFPSGAAREGTCDGGGLECR